MCNPNLKEIRESLVNGGKITPEESKTIRDRAMWLGIFMSLIAAMFFFVVGFSVGRIT
jgi:hypothetical protein